MKIQLHEISIAELVEGYSDDGDDGVRGYGGRLDIRPPYQREFVYKDRQRQAVIESIKQDFPLNVMYWSARGDGTFEIIDGQQRTISISQYVAGDFSVDLLYFDNLPADIKARFLNYKLMIYQCSGTDSEKLDWYRTINIAGETLVEQEIRNAVYAGAWVTDARRYFSKRGCPAFQIGGDYLRGSSIRQDYLETAIKWISDGEIETWMGRHQHEKSAAPLWEYFREVIDWIEATFTKRDRSRLKLMKGQDWGGLHGEHKDADLDANKLEVEIGKLILDDEVEKKAGIYPYVLTRDERHLSLRAFKDGMKLKVYVAQAGRCRRCGEEFEIDRMEADHIVPWSKGGKTVEENCQMLCRKCNREKAAK